MIEQWPDERQMMSHYAAGVNNGDAGIGPSLASDIKSVESVSAVSTVFKEVVLRFGEFLAGFIFCGSLGGRARYRLIVWQE